MTGELLRRLWLPVVSGAVFALPIPAIAQDEKPTQPPQERTIPESQPAQDQATPEQQPAQERAAQPRQAEAPPAKAEWAVKVFDLKHRNAEELNQILTMQWTDPQPTIVTAPGMPVIIQPAGYPVRPGVPGAPPQPATRRTSGYRGADSQLLVSFDPEAKLFFVRGPSEQVKQAESLVKALDVPNEQLKPVEFNGMHMIPVRQDKLQQVTKTLTDLRISNRTTTLGNAAFVVVREETEGGGIVEQAQTIISKYDAGTRTQSGTDAATPQERPPVKDQPRQSPDNTIPER